MVNSRNDPDYRDMRQTDGGRVFVAPHVAAPHGAAVLVMPAVSLTLGRTTLGNDPAAEHPTITTFALGSNAALCFIPTADELEALSEQMAKEATRMRERANAQLADVLGRAKRP
jgi:hypothetical protein